ncbi:YgcG family protein [Novosphingobium colocasiae]|uniref:TPM domain-containing protein n=1 Tax=Novosphingobium colocasiae TaxID=1256513 RepID=UPI0035B21AD3
MIRLRALGAALILGLALVAGIPAQAAPSFPELTGRVVDAANVIPDDAEARLTQKLAALETQSQRQLVVVTVPDLQGYEISDYGYQLGRAWGIGSKARNDGALLIVAPNERKVRIEVGYGLEPVLTDGMSFLIISQAIVPRFKAGDLPGGIEAGSDAIIRQLTLPPEEAAKVAAAADQARQSDGGGGWVGPLIFVVFILFFFILPMIRSASRGGRRTGGWGAPIVWIPGGSSGSSWGSGGSDWGGGGFSGGGGSFGGGGSSGSW